jgi:transposase
MPRRVSPPRSKQIKTDRIDAAQLAQFYANNLLTFVCIPEPALEQDRDLLRTRQNLVQQQTDLRKHLQALLRRNGLHYKAQTRPRTYWTIHHSSWLERTINAASGSLKVNLELLVRHLKDLTAILAAYDQESEELATTARYEKSVQALICYKEIKHTLALTMITEIGGFTLLSIPANWSPGWAWISGNIPPGAPTIGLASRNTALAMCARPSSRRINAATAPPSSARS